MEKELIPRLRFPNFKDNWNRVKLGDISIKVNSGKTPLGGESIYLESGVIFIRSQNVNDNQLNLENVSYIPESINLSMKNSVVKPNDILLNITGASLGRSCVVPNDFSTGNVNQHVCIIRLNDKNDPRFIQSILSSSKGQNKLLNLQTGSGREGLNFDSIKKYEINIPSLKEQQKIASFLSAIDIKLQALKKKKELIEQYKKGVMQKIFSQELRFKDQNGKEFPEWKMRKLNEICDNFIVPMRDKPKELNGDIPWCRIEDFDGKYLSKSKSNQGVTVKTVKEMNLKIFPLNTLLVSCSANLGFCAIVKKELITNQTFIGLVPDLKKVNVEYLYYIMKLSAHRLNVLSSGTTISYLSREQFEKFEIAFPCYKEQTLIANFISSIDNKIDAIVSQIQQNNGWKKGLLQKLFV